tara:strand:+ start:253 stop:648 length:396 start_codon:yes stop_codon:yes gene_type:complete
MSLYQLFTKPPTKCILDKLLKCFDLKNLEDTKIFTKKDLNELNSTESINDIIIELNEFYLPCKSKKYLLDLNNKKIITILRQFIRYFDYFVFSKEKYIQGEKYISYQLMPINKKGLMKIRKKDENYIISFD